MYRNVILSSGGFKTEGYLEDLLNIMGCTDSTTTFYGSSMGAFWAVGASFGKEVLMSMIVKAKRYVEDVRESWIQNFGTCQSRMRDILVDTLPEDITPVQNRCIVKVTELSWTQPYVTPIQIRTYNDKDDLINVVMSSMYVPIFSCLTVTNYCRGKFVIDGCVTEFYLDDVELPSSITLHYKKIINNNFPFIDFLSPICKEDGVTIDGRFLIN